MDYSDIVGAILARKKTGNQQNQLRQKREAEDRFYQDQAKIALPIAICCQIARYLVQMFTKR